MEALSVPLSLGSLDRSPCGIAEYDAQPALITMAIRTSIGAPVLPPKSRRQPLPAVASHGQ
jgi:hypothetical protein